MSRKEGQFGEDFACEILINMMYKILERNFLSRYGEIDIIAEKDKRIHFVEVKYRKSQGFGLPQEFVTKKKLDKILRTAKIYLFQNDKMANDYQVDVIAIEKESSRYEIFENVLTEGLS